MKIEENNRKIDLIQFCKIKKNISCQIIMLSSADDA